MYESATRRPHPAVRTPLSSGRSPRPTAALFLLSVLVALGCFATGARAFAPQGGGFETQVRVVNQSSFARREWVLATVPFPIGAWTAGKRFGVPGISSEILPFGAPWADGSIRFGQIAFRANLQPRQERLYTVREVTGQPPAFRYSPWVQRRLSNFDVELAVGLPEGQVRRVRLARPRVVEDSATRRTTHYRSRIPDTQLVYDLWITFLPDQDSARFELRLTSSLVGSPEWEQPIEWVTLSPFGAIPLVRGTAREQIVQTPFDPDGWNPALLMDSTTLFDGQAREWFGDLLFIDPGNPQPDQTIRIESLLALLEEPWYGIATNWPSSRAWGPFGYLPPPPPWITDGGRAAAIQSRSDFEQWYRTAGHPWEDRPLALRENPAVTGTQHDFGVGKFVDVFVSAMPHRIEEVRYTAGEEACRPVHHREASGDPLRARQHPNWVARAGRTHWSSSVSPDRLGKPAGQPSLRTAAHGWFGKDHEHWSSLVLASAYLLTGSHSLRMELDNDAELFLASHLVPSIAPGSPANGIGNARALGRVMLTMAWNVLLTNRGDVSDRLVARCVECVAPQHYGLANGGTVLPITLTHPDARTIASGDSWSPWQEAQAVLGLSATAHVTGSPDAHLLAVVIARNLIEHGWRVDFENTMVAYAVRYLPGGRAIPPSEMNNPEYYAWPTSPRSFNFWSLPATRLAIRYATLYGEPHILRRAQVIEQYTELQREWPRTGAAWDSYADWDCIE